MSQIKQAITDLTKLFRALDKKILLFSLVGLLGFLVTLILFVTPQKLFKRASAPKASLHLPATLLVNQDEVFSLPVMLDTQAESIAGVDIVLTFDRQFLELQELTHHPLSSTLKCFFPLTQDKAFNSTHVTNQANTDGRIIFGAITQNQTGDVFLQAFQGVLGPASPLATLTFKALKPGTTTVSFVTSPATEVHSLITRETDSQNTLASTTPLTLTIAALPDLTPTATGIPTATAAPTQTPTHTPTPQPPTVTPLPSQPPTPTPLPTAKPTPTSTASINLELPTVRISSPLDQASVICNSVITLSAEAKDNQGLPKVDFYYLFDQEATLLCSQPEPPYTCDWKVPDKPGKYTLIVRAYDPSLNMAEDQILLSAKNASSSFWNKVFAFIKGLFGQRAHDD